MRWMRALFMPPIGLGVNGSRVTGCKEHIALSRLAATEGMVLLKNEDSILPIKKGAKVALFGKGTIDYVKGGGGSGDVTVSYIKNLYDGMKEKEQQGKVTVFEPLVDFYKDEVTKQYKEGSAPGMTVEPEVPADLLKQASAFTDTAIISICRYSGEDWDRALKGFDGPTVLDQLNETPDFYPVTKKFLEQSEKIFDKGDFYLTTKEQAMVDQVTANFENVIVVLNVGGMVDSAWFADNDDISSVLMAWQAGMEGGLAIADILVGDASPSGRLTDTFAKEITDYPSTDDFHNSIWYSEYSDDIFVGYRYFETIPGAAGKVNFPFGFGLNYTEFDWEVVDIEPGDIVNTEPIDLTAEQAKNIDIYVTVDVTNVGDYDGKDVLQLYFEAPEGKLTKAKRVLGGFAKTRLLKPGETQRITLRISVPEMASYDDSGVVAKSAYVLEEGRYKVYLGADVRDAYELLAFDLKENVVVEQLSEKCKPYKLSKRLKADGSFEDLEVSEYPADPCVLDRIPTEGYEGTIPYVMAEENRQRVPWIENNDHTLEEVADGKISLDEFMAQLNIDELIHLTCGHRGIGITNTGSMGAIFRYGVPTINTADGPAGLRIEPQCQVYTTAFPCATLLASTWNEDIVEQVGVCGAREVKEQNIGIWLTPAMNIHRSPLCGRNFEYYSEDPYLAGKIGAAMVRGIQSQHIGASVKHFACNNKETNRKESDSIISERALREVYLRGFEIVVKESDPWTIMSSYNKLNGVKTSESKDLLTGILRDEWGFNGIVTSDWWNHSEHYIEIKAGNDVKMMNGYPERVKEALDKGEISVDEIKICAKRVLEMILKMD
ncbi:MAG: glycoside hydrolase family 3 C-terminal domain-containing protein [Lachnospiraceae bacterium]|nr:glycoside hydrolase family 3 C-terminal domain-containing protein [Lachnospiraceae bacterium]